MHLLQHTQASDQFFTTHDHCNRTYRPHKLDLVNDAVEYPKRGYPLDTLNEEAVERPYAPGAPFKMMHAIGVVETARVYLGIETHRKTCTTSYVSIRPKAAQGVSLASPLRGVYLITNIAHSTFFPSAPTYSFGAISAAIDAVNIARLTYLDAVSLLLIAPLTVCCTIAHADTMARGFTRSDGSRERLSQKDIKLCRTAKIRLPDNSARAARRICQPLVSDMRTCTTPSRYV